MDGRMRIPGGILMLAGMVLAGLVFFSGCQRKPPATPPEPQVKQASGQEQAEVKATATEQTTCPIMGGAIDKTIFVEYKGKKVYFCCKGCPETFLANPEKYLAKLPQFQN